MPEFQVDDIVDITVKGARVVNTFTTHRGERDGTYVDTGTILVFRHPNESDKHRSHTVNMGAEGVTVECVAPAEWPPRPGDLWRGPKKYEGKILSGSSILWFARLDRNSDIDDRLELIPADGNLSSFDADPDAVLARFAPLTLVHREEATTDA